MTKQLIGYSLIYRCEIDGPLLRMVCVPPDGTFQPPIDVVEHFNQRGEGHKVSCLSEPVFNYGGPTFEKGSRVIPKSEFWQLEWTQLAGTVLGTLVDDDDKEWVGYINDMGNPHLEDADTLVEIE
jgi:hypothetical protein